MRRLTTGKKKVENVFSFTQFTYYFQSFHVRPTLLQLLPFGAPCFQAFENRILNETSGRPVIVCKCELECKATEMKQLSLTKVTVAVCFEQ